MRGLYVGIWIGFRYLGTAQRRLSAATLFSVVGLALGVAVLILVMSVMNGFQMELRQRLLSAIPHIEFLSDHLATEPITPELLANNPQVVGAGRFVRFEAIAKGAGDSRVVSVWAVESNLEHQVSSIPDSLVEGRWLVQGEQSLVLGRPLARRLGLSVGDRLTLLLLDQPAGTQIPKPRYLTFVLAGLFELNIDLDYSLVFADVDASLKALPASAYRGGWRFRLTDPLLAPDQVSQLAAWVPDFAGISIRTWADTFGNLFQAVLLEKAIMSLLLLLIVVLACLSVVSTQALAADQKSGAIAILRTLGMGKTGILLTFLVQGFAVGGAGIVIGGLAGIVLTHHISDIMIWVEAATGFSLLKDTYFERLPVVWQWYDLAVVFSLALLLTLASALYPALRAARARPAVALAMPG